MKWILIERAAPVLNTPHFSDVFGGKDGRSLPLNQTGHPYPYEFVALPQSHFPIRRELPDSILEIEAKAYSSEPLYIDRRFGEIREKEPERMQKFLPSADLILERMEKRIGTPYVWGGNWAEGIPEMLHYYPPKGPLDLRTKTLWTFQGLDCSGLLYEAAEGLTPRNSGQLIKFGRPLSTSNLTNYLHPLDMIVYPGHVLFVRDLKTIIESKSPFGVRVCPIDERLDELSKERTLVDEWTPVTDRDRSFIIRRFISS
jgi:hypothetical protein